MPCYDPDSSATAVEHRFTRMLCSACRQLESAGTTPGNPELAAWWEAHKAADKAREEREKAEQEAFKKFHETHYNKSPLIWTPGTIQW